MKLKTRPIDMIALSRLTDSGIDPLIARLYAARGIRGPEDCELALAGMLPPRMLGLDDAAREVADAIAAEATIVVVGDFDCDGATGVATAVTGLRAMGANVDYLVPSRFADGYGLSPRVVDVAADHPRIGPAELLITVDNGIGAHAGIDRANELGIPVVVTDHHLAGTTLPAAAAIVDPNQPGCPFPSKSIAGVGVMLYLLTAVRTQLRDDGHFADRKAPALGELLDLVALGTVADIVGLDQNNRRLVAAGLERIRGGRARPGIRALFEVAGKSIRQATVADLGFLIGPRINAAGRLADMSLGIECLLATSDDAALEMASELDRINRERREIEQVMRDQAEAATIDCPPERRSLVVFDPGWHQGVVGLVATRIKDRHHRPCIALAPEAEGDANGTLRGSGRSIPGLHLRDVLDVVDRRHPGLMLRFGGHAMAAGLTLAAGGRVAELEQAFEAAVAEVADASVFERELITDGPLESSEFTIETAERLDAEVWGQGFAVPLFSGRFRVLEQWVLKERHLKLVLVPDEPGEPGETREDDDIGRRARTAATGAAGRSGGVGRSGQAGRSGPAGRSGHGQAQRLDAIAFGRNEPLAEHATLTYRLKRDDFRSLPRLQLMVVDVIEG